MATLLSKHAGLDEVQLRGMISYAQKQFDYLENTSPDALYSLCRLMIDSYFVFEKKPTPVRSSYEFLRKITQTNIQNESTGAPMFAERDFVFAIKMFGLRIRLKNGVNQFVPDNVPNYGDEGDGGEVAISNGKEAKLLEFYVSDVHKRTKIQTHAIQSATNRLLREWREMELARLFTDMMEQQNKTIGQSREFLRANCGVKDHEFVRIRAYAIELGIFQSKRNPSRSSRKITLDEDVVSYVESLSRQFVKKKMVKATLSQVVNQALRDLSKLGSPA